MRIAVLSDIHSNNEALKSCYEYIKQHQVNHVIFLGDYVTDYPNPQLTMKVIKEIKKSYPCTFIKGNREDYMIDYVNGLKNWTNSSKDGALLHNFKNLTKEDIAFFESLSIYKEMEFKGCTPFLIMHGSYERNNHLLGPNWDETALAEMYRIIEESKYNLMIGGHCHYQFISVHKGKRLINAGAVGGQSDGDPRAKMLFLDWIDNDWKETLLAIDYNYDAMNQQIIDTDYFNQARWWAIACSKNLYTGQNSAYKLLLTAITLAKEDDQELSELYFEKAAKQLKLDEWKEQYGL